MMFFRRRRAGVVDPAHLAEHDAVRDVVARLLAARELLAGESGAGAVAFLFSSLREGQGTSTLAAAVARGLAESGRPTLLAAVDDPAGERPLPGAIPLNDFLGAPRRVPVQPPPLATVRVPARFTDFPESARDLRAWLDGFQVLILDAPTMTDSLTRYWVPKVDGVVLVVDGEAVALKAVLQTRQDLERLGGRLVGVVLNRYRSRIPRWMAPYFVYG
jgi:Mrp family chromosome partitioning ATPase